MVMILKTAKSYSLAQVCGDPQSLRGHISAARDVTSVHLSNQSVTPSTTTAAQATPPLDTVVHPSAEDEDPAPVPLSVGV